MVHHADNNLTRRASLAVVGGLLLLPLVEAVQAAEQPNAQQIVEKLQKLTPEQEILKEIQDTIVRGDAAELRRIEAAEQAFKEALRDVVIRSPTEEDRIIIGNGLLLKPSIDLEINFDFDSAVINASAKSLAIELGLALANQTLRGTRFLVAGHTDGKGSKAYNLDLSQRRAEAIKAFLVEFYRVPAANLIAIGFGMERLKNPSASFADENRRVQVVNMLKAE